MKEEPSKGNIESINNIAKLAPLLLGEGQGMRSF
jgi:hypothetical protein